MSRDHRSDRGRQRPAAVAVAATLALAAATFEASAQSAGPCDAGRTSDGARVVLTCAAGLTIEIERSARYGVVDSDGDGRPEGMRLDGGAALVDAEQGAYDNFQILTPTAIASVRGTEWITDAATATTSVFVRSGAVNVVARGSNAGVVLRRGEGTDVPPNAAELRAIRWGQGRIDALLARFGR